MNEKQLFKSKINRCNEFTAIINNKRCRKHLLQETYTICYTLHAILHKTQNTELHRVQVAINRKGRLTFGL